jgi:hemoglobin
MEAEQTGPPKKASGDSPRPGARTTYVALGEDGFFRRLVENFYGRIETDPVLRPLFPASLEAGKERQFLFLTQFFGGPGRYSALYGHPRLRARHLAFPIGQRERDRWLGHMLAALAELAPPEPQAMEMQNYFASTSQFLINRDDNVRVGFPATPGG